jgi:hypothetical protein
VSSTSRILVIVAVLATVGSARAVAQGADAAALAKAKVAEATQLLDDGKPAKALQLLQEAYGLVPAASHLYNIGIAYQALGRDADALETFERFLKDAKGINPKYQEDAQAQIATLQSKLVGVTIHCAEAGASVDLDGRPRGTTPLPATLWLTPGHHRLAITKAGFRPFTSTVADAAGAKVIVEAQIVSEDPSPTRGVPEPPVYRIQIAAAPERTEPAPRPLLRRPWLWIAVGTVLAGSAAAIFLATRPGPRGTPGCPANVNVCIDR